ncbi:MAG: hypothetical protein AAFY65_13225 [Pseudomonadota bacterium]
MTQKHPDTIANLARRLDAQIAYGRWNVGPLANRLEDARLAALPAWRRAFHRRAAQVAEAALLGATYGAFALIIWRMVTGLF